MCIKLEDSCLNGEMLSELETNIKKADALRKAIDKLNAECQKFISFINQRERESQKIIWCESADNDLKIYTSHFVGFYSTMIDNKQVNITINPRFGDKMLNHLFSYALGIYMSPSLADSIKEKSNLWLVAMLWVNALEEAIRRSHIPKGYEEVVRNERFYKGSLNIQKHTIHNLVNQERFYCKYAKQTYNIAINRAIRHAFSILSKDNSFGKILRSIVSHDKMLCDFGVGDKIEIGEFKKIKYTPLIKPYKKVMELSRVIIEHQGMQSIKSRKKSFGYFIDMSEIWENYLYKIMQKKLNGFELVNGNFYSGDYLFKGNIREIRPDFIIQDNKGENLAIIDAKYKDYKQIGRYQTDGNAINREDLYQICTYLYHYNAKLAIILSPSFDKDEPERASFANKESEMIVFGMNLNSIESNTKDNQNDFYKEIEKMEDEFGNKLKKFLEITK